RGNRVPERIGAVSPAIDDDEHEWASRRAVRAHADGTTSAAARTICVKSASFRLAPPTRAPSISGCSIRVRALAGVTLPPEKGGILLAGWGNFSRAQGGVR